MAQPDVSVRYSSIIKDLGFNDAEMQQYQRSETPRLHLEHFVATKDATNKPIYGTYEGLFEKPGREKFQILKEEEAADTAVEYFRNVKQGLDVLEDILKQRRSANITRLQEINLDLSKVPTVLDQATGTRNDLKETTTKFDRKVKEAQALQEVVAKKEEELNDLKERINALESNNNNLTSQLEQQSRTSTEGIKAAEQRAAEGDAKILQLNAELDGKQNELKDAKDQALELEKELEAAYERMIGMVQTSFEEAKDVSDNIKQIADIKKQISERVEKFQDASVFTSSPGLPAIGS